MARPDLVVLTITPGQAGWDAVIQTNFERFRALAQDNPIVPKVYTVGTLPTASNFEHCIAYVSDGTTSKLMISNGTAWSYLNTGNDDPEQNANLVKAGPTTGIAATPTYRALVTADLPTPYSTLNHAANLFLASPSGSSGAFTARAITTADLPAVIAGKKETISYAASVSINPNSSVKEITLTGNLSVSIQNGSFPAQRLTVWYRQDGTGNRTLTYTGSNLRYGTDLPSTETAITATASKASKHVWEWDNTDSKWDFVGRQRGF